MKKHIGTKSTAALGIVLLAAAGAVGASGSAPVIGRFQIACTDSQCYLVDTATGQVWTSNGPRNEFRAPKIDVSSPAVAAEASAYLGRWVLPEDQSGEQGNIHIRPDGKVVITDHGQEYLGSWTTEGNRIVIVVEDENFAGEALPDGRLSLWERGEPDGRTILTRLPGDVQDPTPGLSAAASGFLGRWISNDPEADGLGLQLEPDGLAILTSDDRTYAGHWRTEGTLLRVNLNDDEEEGELLGQLQPNGDLNVWEPANDGTTISLRRAPGAEQPTAVTVPAGAAGFIGQWVCDDPDEEEITLQVEPGGRVVGIEDDGDVHEGSWKVQGTQLSMSFEDEEDIVGALLPEGRLSLWEDGNPDHRLSFKRPPTEAQVQAMTTAAAEAGFLGRWVSADPDKDNLELEIEPAGVAIATNKDKRFEASWSLSGSRLTLRVEDDELSGEVTPDGRLTLQEEDGGDKLVFRRPAQ